MPNTVEATITRSTGPAFVERNGTKIALNEGDGIYESDLLITGSETTLDISFRDGTKSRIGPDSEMRIVDFEFGPNEEPSFVVNLTQGAMRTVTGEIVKLNPEAFEVVTPRATAGIRGTEFITEVNGDTENHIVLFISGGSVMLVEGNDGSSVSFDTPLQGTSIAADGSMSTRSYSLNEMQSLINSIAPSIGGNIPTSSEEQGAWTDAGALTEANSSAVVAGMSVDIVYDDANALEAVLSSLQEAAGIVVNSVVATTALAATDLAALEEALESSLVTETLLATTEESGIFAPLSSSTTNSSHANIGNHQDNGHSGNNGNNNNNNNNNDNDNGYDGGSSSDPVESLVITSHVDHTVKTGGNNDSITISANINSSGVVDAGHGNNTIVVTGHVNGQIIAGNGSDTINIGGTINGGAHISTGAGNDFIKVSNDINGTIDGGAGLDIVVSNSLTQAELNKLTNIEYVITGNGAENITSFDKLAEYGVTIAGNELVFDSSWNSAGDVYTNQAGITITYLA